MPYTILDEVKFFPNKWFLNDNLHFYLRQAVVICSPKAFCQYTERNIYLPTGGMVEGGTVFRDFSCISCVGKEGRYETKLNGGYLM